MAESYEELKKQLAETPAASDPRLRTDLLLKIAFHLLQMEDWDEMLAMTAEARKLAEAIGYNAGLARSIGVQAFGHYIRSDYSTALDECMKALELADSDPEAEGKIATILGLINWSIGNFEEALRQADRSRALLHDLDLPVDEAYAYSIRGGVLHSLGEYEQALAAHLRCLEIFRKNDHPSGISRALAGVGSAYSALGRTTEAWQALEECLSLARRLGHGLNISRALNDMGELADAANDLDRATELHQGALAIRRIEGYRQAEVTSLINLGKVAFKQKKQDVALRMLTRGLSIAQEIGARPKVAMIEQLLADVYEQAGNFPEALHHFKAYDRIKTALASDQSALRRKGLELEAQLEFARKDAEIHRLRNVELAQAIEQLQLTQAELVNSEKMAALGGLVAGVAHEINSPLGVIRSSSDTAVRCVDRIAAGPQGLRAIDALKANTRLIADATQRIEMLVKRLKSFAGIDSADYAFFDTVQALEDVIALLSHEIRTNVSIVKNFRPVPKIYCYAAEMSQVFMHLLRNAAQAIEKDGAITVTVESDASHIFIMVCDSGRGIAPEDIDKLFNPGFNLHDQRVKASLSLFTCMRIVKKHGGDIQVASAPGEGSTFRIVLPRSLEHAELNAATA